MMLILLRALAWAAQGLPVPLAYPRLHPTRVLPRHTYLSIPATYHSGSAGRNWVMGQKVLKVCTIATTVDMRLLIDDAPHEAMKDKSGATSLTLLRLVDAG